MKRGGARSKERHRSHHLSGRRSPDLQPFDPSVLGHHACLLGIVLGQERMTKGSQMDRVVAVRKTQCRGRQGPEVFFIYVLV